jgi:hypothetical protein
LPRKCSKTMRPFGSHAIGLSPPRHRVTRRFWVPSAFMIQTSRPPGCQWLQRPRAWIVPAASGRQNEPRVRELALPGAVGVHRPDGPVAVAVVRAVLDAGRVGRPDGDLARVRRAEVADAAPVRVHQEERVVGMPCAQPAEGDLVAARRPVREHAAGRRLDLALVGAVDVDREQALEPVAELVGEVVAAARPEDEVPAVRRPGRVEVLARPRVRDLVATGAVGVHDPDVAAAAAVRDPPEEVVLRDGRRRKRKHRCEENEQLHGLNSSRTRPRFRTATIR